MKLNRNIGRVLAIAGLLGGLATAVRGQTTTFGFETETVGNSPAASGAVTFTVYGDTSVQSAASTGQAAFASSGSQYLFITSLTSDNMPYATSGAGEIDAGTLWAAAFGSQPNTLSSSLSLVSASALQVSVYLTAGSTLSFDAQMLTTEPTNLSLQHYNDAAFVASSVDGGAVSLTTLASVEGSTFSSSASDAFDSQTNIFNYSYTAVTSGTYTFLLGVGDATFAGSQSGLVLDNLAIVTAVPEPATTALIAGSVMLAGGAILRRRRRSATVA